MRTCTPTTLKDVMNIDRKKTAILLIAVIVAATMSGIALSVYAANNGEPSCDRLAERINGRMMAGPYGRSNGMPRGPGCHGPIEVSEEFAENAISIAESDEDVQALLNDGYSTMGVRPIIKTIIEADGSVESKATDAIVMLEKDETGHAGVWVDLEEAKVTEIAILTRTMIEKP